MKILFLDNDGVICLADQWGSRHRKLRSWMQKNGKKASYDMDHRFDNFDVKAIKILNEVLVETGADYVISSDWRYHATLEELQSYYLAKGVIKAPIDMTPHTKDINPEWWLRHKNFAKLEQERCLEIKWWLEHHPDVTHWVAVDDLNLGFHDAVSGDFINEYGLSNFVLTPKSREGIKQSGIKEKIIKYLI